MNSLLFINLISITIILFFCLYLDLKFRKISNKYIISFFSLCLILNFIEFFSFYNDLILFFFFKIFILLLVFLFSLLLFSLKIIGGSDGKLLVLIFFFYPIKYLNIYLVLLFFLLFSLFFLLLFFITFIINSVKKNAYSFEILFNFHLNSSIFKKIFIKMFFKFFNLSELGNYQVDKIIIKSLTIIYNDIKKKFQILAQYRPPLVIVCIFSYYLIFFLKIGI